MTGGWVTGSTIHIGNLDLVSDLWVVAGGDIEVTGQIAIPIHTTPGERPVNVTIRSLGGTVERAKAGMAR